MSPASLDEALKGALARRLTLAVFLAVAFVVAFRPHYRLSQGVNFDHALQVLFRLWFFFTPAGTTIGLLVGLSILRSVLLTQVTIPFLRFVRWTPLLVSWVLPLQLTISSSFETPLPGTWLWAYGMVTVAMTTCYDLMVEVLIVRRSREDALRVVMRGSAIHGIFVALILELSIWSGFFFNPYPGQSQDGYAFGLVVAIVIILIDWVTKAKFVTVADERGRRLVEEVKCEDLNFLLGAAALGLLALIFWQGLTGLVFLNSPLDVLAEFYQLVFMSDFYRDVAVSLKEILLGICISGVIGAAIATFMHRVASLNNPLQALVHALIIAPIALLPRILGFGVISLSNWSVACVCAFALCPLTRVILALRDHGLITRITLSFDDALPFAAAAIVYGEAMNATAGFGFSMVVAGATFQTARGLANFLALLIMISVISLILRFVAKISLGRKAVNDDLGHGD